MIPKFIKKHIPLVLFTLKAYLRTTALKVVLPSKEGGYPRVFIFLAADYGNLGDVAITLAQKKILQLKYPNSPIIEVPASLHLDKLKGICKQINADDIITIIGGGNMGDMYGGYEMYRQLIIKLFPNNKIISFPQTTDFANTQKGIQFLKSAKYTYQGRNLVLLAREHESFLFMQKNFKANCFEVPDIVMTLKHWDNNNERHGISLCFRNDKEKVLSTDVVKGIHKCCMSYDSIYEIDTHVGDKFDPTDKFGCLESFLNRLKKSRILVTDRLHGMIFAYITGTPAIVFDNSNKKVGNCFRWIENCGFICYMEKFDEAVFEVNLGKLLKISADVNILEDNRTRFYRIFDKIL